MPTGFFLFDRRFVEWRNEHFKQQRLRKISIGFLLLACGFALCLVGTAWGEISDFLAGLDTDGMDSCPLNDTVTTALGDSSKCSSVTEEKRISEDVDRSGHRATIVSLFFITVLFFCLLGLVHTQRGSSFVTDRYVAITIAMAFFVSTIGHLSNVTGMPSKAFGCFVFGSDSFSIKVFAALIIPMPTHIALMFQVFDNVALVATFYMFLHEWNAKELLRSGKVSNMDGVSTSESLTPENWELFAIATAMFIMAGMFFVWSAWLRDTQDHQLFCEHVKRVEAEENRKSFISYILHEIRNPLSGCGLILSECTSRLQLPDMPPAIDDLRQRDDTVQSWLDTFLYLFSTVESQLESINYVSNDCLALEKLEAGCFDFEFTAFNVLQWLHELYENVKLSFVLQGLRLKLSIPAPLLFDWYAPQEPEVRNDEHEGDKSAVYLPLVSRVRGVADHNRLAQVLSNFLSNAKKFSPKGSTVSLKVALLRPVSSKSRSVEGNLVRISVEDQGVGITKEDQAKLFKPYSQIRSGELQKGGGTGLGLSLSKAFVEAHHGSVGVESQGQNKGSEFFLELMLPYPTDEQLEASKSATLSPEIGKRILRCVTELPNGSSLPSGIFSPQQNRRRGSQSTLSPTTMKQRTSSPPSPSSQNLQAATPSGHKRALSPGGRSSMIPDSLFEGYSALCLLVDDNYVCTLATEYILQRMQLSFEMAESGEDALAKIKEGKRYRLILIDYQMPHMDGVETTKEITRELRRSGADSSSTVIVGLTGASEEYAAAFREAGARECLRKPIKAAVLQKLAVNYIHPRWCDGQPCSETCTGDRTMEGQLRAGTMKEDRTSRGH
ncbi:unnamed protein product [Vitrella brassicaformis CCMP3155]|uniref:histidine kinase n=1 Tax=Vitrella brassicaformis (strain CCMP3155) TaxID=1169540 RepID=A0A0G4ELZ9_VITBC|nr:unnamed protein product [Vitrella brassicaformis CCMP3155]|eukprot:CEL98454.1 unnamed protein product [Vitrella brassicaformis CCMP3155]